MYIHRNKAIRRLPCCWHRCPHRLFLQTLELFYSIGTFCISLEFYTNSEYLNNVFRTLGSTKHLNDICLTYTLRSKNVKFNQTFIQPNPNVPETFSVSWVIPSLLVQSTSGPCSCLYSKHPLCPCID